MCAHWRSVCLKGHALSSPEGCPLRKFASVDGAGYAPERPDAQMPVPKVGCCGQSSELTPLTWPQVIAHFGQAMLRWAKEGLPMVGQKVHGERYAQCVACDQFKGFYCAHCKCVAYLLTKVATSECPKTPPRWRKTTSTAPGG